MLRIKSRATRLLTTRDRLAGITIMWPSGHNYGMWLGQPIYDTLRSAVMDDNPKSLKKSIANVDLMMNQRLSGPRDVPGRLDYTMLSIEIYLECMWVLFSGFKKIKLHLFHNVLFVWANVQTPTIEQTYEWLNESDGRTNKWVKSWIIRAFISLIHEFSKREKTCLMTLFDVTL